MHFCQVFLSFTKFRTITKNLKFIFFCANLLKQYSNIYKKEKFMKLSMIVFIVVSALQIVSAADVALVRNGKAKSVIVVENENVSTRKAAEELQQMIKQRTKADIAIISAKDKIPSGMIPVYLGLSPRTAKLGADTQKIQYDGYFFKATPEYVVIAGRDKPQTNEAYYGQTFVYCNYQHHYYAYGEKGTVNGVYKILEKYAGNRHYMPGKLGEVVPESPDFILPVAEYTQAPAFSERYIYGIYFKDASPDYMRWYYRMCAGGQNNHINHTYRRMLGFKKSNPEYFALIDGKRDFNNLSTANTFGNLCMTNKEGIKAFAKLAQNFFDKNPDYNIYPVVPQDGMYKICECADCQKLASPHLGHTGRFSNAVFHHAAEIAKILAKTHPGKMIGALAYEGYRIPPETDLPPNLAVRICYTRQSLRTPENKKMVEDAIKGYKNKNVPILVWTYPLFNHRPPMKGLPVLYPDILQENIRFNRANGVVGEFSECGYYGGNHKDMHLPGIAHLNDYLRCQLLWDPDMDVRAELEKYYKNFYGPAAKEMKEFWSTGEKLFMKYGEATLYTVADLKNFEAVLARAAAKAPADTVYGKRIRLIQSEIKPYFNTMYLLRGKQKFFGVSYVRENIPMSYQSDNIWKHAREYTLNFKDGRTVPSAENTKLFAIANNKGLALHIICNEPSMSKLIVNAKKRDDVSWDDDCLEFFIVSADRKVNRHYFVSPNGIFTDGRRTRDVNTADWAWNGGMTVKTAKKQNTIFYTLFIPWSDIECTFDNMPELLFQLYRRRNNGNIKQGVYQTMFPSVAFHNYSPEYFARFEFLGDENRLKNSGFEISGSQGKAANWNGQGDVCSDQVKSGRKAFKLTGRKGYAPSIYSDKINVREDFDYSITLDHLGAAGYIYALFYDSNGKVVPEPGRSFYWTDKSDKWRTLTFQGRVPAKAVSCSIVLRSFAGECRFDNVEFRGGMKFTSLNKNFRNGSFEELGPDGKPVGWGKNVNLESSSAADGRNAVRVQVKNNDSLYSDRFAVTGGSDYIVKFKSRGSDGYIYIIAYDAKGKAVKTQYFHVKGNDSWTENTVTGLLPENAVKCSVMVRNFAAPKANGSWFDDIRFYSK